MKNKPKQKKVRYEEMLPHEVVRARKSMAVAYLPVGGVEWHGVQNALGLDTIKAHGIAIECAKKIGGIVFPPLFYGEPREGRWIIETHPKFSDAIFEKMELPKSNFIKGYMKESDFEANINYIRLIYHILCEIKSLGFKLIVVLPGHYPALNHSQMACCLFNNEEYPPKEPSFAWTDYMINNKIPNAGDHAGPWETSLLMALRPDLVDLTQLPEDKNATSVGVGPKNPRFYASVKFGKRGVREIVKFFEEKINSVRKELEF